MEVGIDAPASSLDRVHRMAMLQAAGIVGIACTGLLVFSVVTRMQYHADESLPAMTQASLRDRARHAALEGLKIVKSEGNKPRTLVRPSSVVKLAEAVSALELTRGVLHDRQFGALLRNIDLIDITDKLQSTLKEWRLGCA